MTKLGDNPRVGWPCDPPNILKRDSWITDTPVPKLQKNNKLIKFNITLVDWVEEQMAPLVESMEPRKVRTYEEKLCDAQEEAADLNWIHYLGQYCIPHICIVPYTIGF